MAAPEPQLLESAHAAARALFFGDKKLCVCTPADAIFAKKGAPIVDALVPTLFIGATLCVHFEIVRYIESGSFGMFSVCSLSL